MLLLVLDNCEHLLAACRDLTARLLRTCPQIRILATSREGLGVPGETIWRVPSLSVPDTVRQLPPTEELVLYDAVRLFAERAQATKSDFAVTRQNAVAVAHVCQRLDGIPLAIELAAARVKVLTAEQIATRLDDRFRLLTGGSPIMLPRHQTLGAAIDWSYNLLSETERTMLRRLSVFAGGWTLEAAEFVCAGEGVATDRVLDLLTSLVDKSLVMVDMQHGEARYRLLETLRQYARDQLVGAREATDVQRRHRAWYLGLAERAEGRMSGPEQTMWLERLEVEHDNLRTALGWIGGKEDAETRLRLAAALDGFWDAHTHWGEGRKWLETALAGSRDTKSTARVRALWGAGSLAWREGDTERSTTLYEESLALARELGDQTGIAMGLFGRAVMIMQQGDFDAAMALFEESLELARRLQDKGMMARALGVMGWTARRKGDYARALALIEESLAILRTLGPKRWIAFALRATGHAVRLKGDLERAAELYRESLALFGETGDKYVATECIEGLALIASAQGRFERAARLFAADEAARETFGITMRRVEPGDHERLWATTREGLGDVASMAAWAEGRAMTLEQAIEYALAGETN
jgi:non-specific serine/threonine protein kinase